MSDKIIKYMHHGKEVSVKETLKGKHRQHCLCFICKRFHPEDRASNCKIANILYTLCQDLNMVTPVWECADFEKVEDENK